MPPSDTEPGQGATLSSGTWGEIVTDGPRIDLEERGFQFFSDENGYHPPSPVFPVGRFWVESSSATSSAAASFSWSCEHGTMTPSEGNESFLSLTSMPQSDNKAVWVIVEVALDEQTKPKRVYLVFPCVRKEFKLESTENFSPHLGETMGVSVAIPGCAHTSEASWVEVEIMRETVGGFDHVAWVDMDSTSSGTDRYHEIKATKRTAWGTWDGMAQAGLGLADHPDVFIGPKGSFNRAMPAVKSGDPVPPPFYAVVARLLDEDKSTVLGAITNAVFVRSIERLCAIVRGRLCAVDCASIVRGRLCAPRAVNSSACSLPGFMRYWRR